MKELNVHEDADIKRLLRCLDIFITTLATTLLDCDYDRAILRAALDKTAYCISLDKLKRSVVRSCDHVIILHALLEQLLK